MCTKQLEVQLTACFRTIHFREIWFLTVSASPSMEMCGGELLLHLSPAYDIIKIQ